jgi:uncharacterized protein (TIGR02145 family)
MKKSLLLFLAIIVYGGMLIAQDTTGQVAYYPFNGNANDESGHGNNGIVYGATLTSDRFGNPDAAYSFNGNSDWIQVMNSTSLNINGNVPMTICAWTNGRSDSAFLQGIVSKWGPGDYEDDQYELYVSYNKYIFQLSEETTWLPSNSDILLNVWVFITGVYDPAVGMSKLYINGVLDTSMTLSFSIRNTDRYIELGRLSDWFYYDGEIDDIRIYNRALHDWEIYDLYHDGGWKVKPIFTDVIDDQFICPGDSTAFTAIAEGIYPISYQWQKDGVDIPGATDSILVFLQVQHADSGEYRCIATNSYGADTTNMARLTIEFTVPSVIQGMTEVDLYQTATYSVVGQPGHLYDFLVEGGTKIDETANSVKVHWLVQGEGHVGMVETSELGCAADTVVLDVFVNNPVTVELTFTAINGSSPVKLDSIRIMNRTQGNGTVLYWPDTVYSLTINKYDQLLFVGYSNGFPLGIPERSQNTGAFQVFQNYPNPAGDHCKVLLYVPEKGNVNIQVTDIMGKELVRMGWMLDKGSHSFRLGPGNGNMFLFTASWNGIRRSIKILAGNDSYGNACSLEYVGTENGDPRLKEVLDTTVVEKESGILDAPLANKTYTFQFATNIPCPGTPTVEYEGQVYNTIQIFSQCWLKENLNVGIMIPVSQQMTNDWTLEKYCFNNKEDSCTKYGGLYQWDEMMEYITTQGTKGICPSGWHIPTDEEWIVLEGAADSRFSIGDMEWQKTAYRGYDAHTNLKSTSGWKDEGNGNDLFGFSALPGGYSFFGTFDGIGYGDWWSSSEGSISSGWCRYLSYAESGISRVDYTKEFGHSVRCIRNF